MYQDATLHLNVTAYHAIPWHQCDTTVKVRWRAKKCTDIETYTRQCWLHRPADCSWMIPVQPRINRLLYKIILLPSVGVVLELCFNSTGTFTLTRDDVGQCCPHKWYCRHQSPLKDSVGTDVLQICCNGTHNDFAMFESTDFMQVCVCIEMWKSTTVNKTISL